MTQKQPIPLRPEQEIRMNAGAYPKPSWFLKFRIKLGAFFRGLRLAVTAFFFVSGLVAWYFIYQYQGGYLTMYILDSQAQEFTYYAKTQAQPLNSDSKVKRK